MLRFIIACIFVGLFLIVSIPILGIEWLIGKAFPMARDISSLRIIQWSFKVILWISGARIHVTGEENIPDDQPVLYIANHRSYFDIIMTYARCRMRTGYVAKKEMLKYPVFRVWMKRLYCLFLDRDDIRQGLQTILTAVQYIKDGISIFIFPEGTRNKGPSELEMLPFHEGSFKVATKSGCLIIPVAISNSQEIFEAHFPRLTPCDITIQYLPPIDPSALSREEQKHLGKYTQGLILEALKNK